MSDPVKGKPIIDEAAKELLTQLARFDEPIFRNLSFDVLGSLVSEFGRLSGLATQHYGIKLSQKIGGVQGSLRNHLKIGIHCDKSLEEIEALHPEVTQLHLDHHFYDRT